jgi:hypothetical protein
MNPFGSIPLRNPKILTPMQQIEEYFNAEKAESVVFLAFGMVGLLLGFYLLFVLKQSFWKGLSVPILVFAVVQLVIGLTIFIRSPKDSERMRTVLVQESHRIQSEELPRMEGVMKNFVRYRYFEIAMMTLGVLLMFGLSHYTFWKGLGLGLFMQCAILLSLDFFAEKRGYAYIETLQRINQNHPHVDQ